MPVLTDLLVNTCSCTSHVTENPVGCVNENSGIMVVSVFVVGGLP